MGVSEACNLPMAERIDTKADKSSVAIRLRSRTHKTKQRKGGR